MASPESPMIPDLDALPFPAHDLFKIDRYTNSVSYTHLDVYKRQGAKWNLFFKDALTEIRKTNPTRGVLMGIAPWGGLSGVPNIEFPDDNYTILTIHYYDPFNFTHQGAEWVANSNPWLGTKWENTQLERNEIISAFAFAQSLAKQKNKPIHVGEFGAYNKADLESRIKWTNFLARWFESQGFSWAYWEWSAGFGIFNPATNQVLHSLRCV